MDAVGSASLALTALLVAAAVPAPARCWLAFGSFVLAPGSVILATPYAVVPQMAPMVIATTQVWGVLLLLSVVPLAVSRLEDPERIGTRIKDLFALTSGFACACAWQRQWAATMVIYGLALLLTTVERSGDRSGEHGPVLR